MPDTWTILGFVPATAERKAANEVTLMHTIRWHDSRRGILLHVRGGWPAGTAGCASVKSSESDKLVDLGEKRSDCRKEQKPNDIPGAARLSTTMARTDEKSKAKVKRRAHILLKWKMYLSLHRILRLLNNATSCVLLNCRTCNTNEFKNVVDEHPGRFQECL